MSINEQEPVRRHAEIARTDLYPSPDPNKEPELFRAWVLSGIETNLANEPKESEKLKARKPTKKEQTNIDIFEQRFIDALEGKSFPEEERERALNYFGGSSEAMHIFDQTAGTNRVAAIKAVGQALDNPHVSQPTKADMVETFITSAYQLTQTHDAMVRLAQNRANLETPLLEGILNYFADRELARRTAEGNI